MNITIIFANITTPPGLLPPRSMRGGDLSASGPWSPYTPCALLAAIVSSPRASRQASLATLCLARASLLCSPSVSSSTQKLACTIEDTKDNVGMQDILLKIPLPSQLAATVSCTPYACVPVMYVLACTIYWFKFFLTVRTKSEDGTSAPTRVAKIYYKQKKKLTVHASHIKDLNTHLYPSQPCVLDSRRPPVQRTWILNRNLPRRKVSKMSKCSNQCTFGLKPLGNLARNAGGGSNVHAAVGKKEIVRWEFSRR